MDQSALVMFVCLLSVGLLYCCKFILENIKGTQFSLNKRKYKLYYSGYIFDQCFFGQCQSSKKWSLNNSDQSDGCAPLMFVKLVVYQTDVLSWSLQTEVLYWGFIYLWLCIIRIWLLWYRLEVYFKAYLNILAIR